MSNNLSLSQVAAAQNQKEVTINDQAGQLDAALTEILTIEVDDSNAYVLTADQFRRSFFIVVTEGSPAPTAAIALQAPAIRRGLFKLLNLTNQTVAIEVPGQSETAPQIAPGENRMLSCDGVNVRAPGIDAPNLGSASIGELLDVDIAGIASGQQLSWNGSALVPVTEPFDVGLHLPDLSTAGALLAEIVLARPADFAAGFSGSTGYARIAATAETVLDVQKNGSNIGTVTFAAASATPVFALASPTSFAAGDRLAIVNEDPADATLAGVSLTFAGTRGSWALAWYDPSWLYRQKITLDHSLVAEDLTDFPVLITHAVVQASLFTHARSDGADIVVTSGDETTRLKRELVTYDAMAGELELYVRIPSLSSVTDAEVYVYYGNAGAAETNDADTWNSDYGIVYHLKEDPAGTAPQARDSTANAVHGTYDIAGATVEDNTLWGGKCILFDNGPRLRVEDNAAIENADRITVEAWVNTLSWPGRAVVCRKEGSYILYNFSGGFSWYLFGPDNRLQYDIAGTLGNDSWGYIVGTYDKDAGTNNQRLYLNGTRVAQMSDTLPIDLNSAALGIGRHVSGIADPFNGHIDAFRIAHVQRSDGWITTTWNNMSDPGAFAVAASEEQQGGEPPPLAGAGVVVCLMG